MAESARAVVVIDDGGVASLVSALLVDDPGATHIRFSGSNKRAREISRERTERLAFASWGEIPVKAGEAETLLAGLREAQRIQAGTVVWPFFAGDDLDAMSLAVSRVRLLDELVAIEASEGVVTPHIETPVLDLDASRVCDLAVDLDAPMDARSVWWCRTDGSTNCGTCEGCRLWQPALAAPRCWEHGEALASR